MIAAWPTLSRESETWFHHRGAFVSAQRLVEPPRLVRLVAEVLDGLEVEQAVDGLGARAPVFPVHLPAELQPPLGHRHGVGDVEDHHRDGGERDGRVERVPQDDEHQAQLDHGGDDREQAEAQQALDGPGAALDRQRQPPRLAPEVETHRERVEVSEHFQRDGADGPLRDVDEDGVAGLVEREGEDPRRAVGEDEGQRHGDEDARVAGAIAGNDAAGRGGVACEGALARGGGIPRDAGREGVHGPPVEHRDVHRRHLRRHQRGEREQHPQPQRRRTGRPQVGQQRAQGLPAARRAFLGDGESRTASHRSRSPFPCTVAHLRCGRRRKNDCRERSPSTLGSRGRRVPAQPAGGAPISAMCLHQGAGRETTACRRRFGSGSGRWNERGSRTVAAREAIGISFILDWRSRFRSRDNLTMTRAGPGSARSVEPSRSHDDERKRALRQDRRMVG